MRRLLESAAFRLIDCVLRLAAPRRYLLLRPRGMPYRMYLNLRESRAMRRRFLGRYEPAKTALLRSALQPGMTFIDIGVNKGYFSLLAASRVGEAGRVIAFEPAPDNCAWIRRSIDANGYANVDLHPVALADRAGEASLALGKTSGSHSLSQASRKRGGDRISVPVDTLDAVLERAGIDHVDVIKIDVEGAELDVLEGARQTLRGSSPLLVTIDIHPEHGVNPQAVVAFLRQLGFEVYGPNGRPCETTPQKPLKEVVATRAAHASAGAHVAATHPADVSQLAKS